MSNDFLGLDRSGNDNNWTVNNMTLAADQVVDSPTNNFATLNPLDMQSQIVLSEGNLKVRSSTTGGGYKVRGTEQLTGKVYFEGLVGAVGGNIGSWFGIADNGGSITAFNSSRRNGFYYNASDMRKMVNGAVTVISAGNSAVAGDVIGLAYDLDNNTFSIYRNNTAILSNESFTNDVGFSAIVDLYRNDSTDTGFILNFGQDSSFAGNKTAQGNQDGNDIGDFYYTPPSGFLALCTKNLPDVAVTPSEHFNTVLYTGNGSTQSITGFGFQPDWIWDKSRNQVNSHMLVDAVRGVGKYLRTNLTNAEVDDASVLTSFDSDGVTVGDINGNATSSSSVMWGWKANGSGSSNTAGTLNSVVSANTDAGFSIVSYTGDGNNGATFGHGLSSTPEIVFIKNRSSAQNWVAWGGGSSALFGRMLLNTTVGNLTSYNATFSSSLVTMPDYDQSWNGNGNEHIAYAFHSVDGYSKVGSYTGNGSTDGTFVYTGFRPKFVMIKNTTYSGSYWHIADSKRLGYNVIGQYLFPNTNEAESNYTEEVLLDLTSNGFKWRGNYRHINGSGDNIVFIAFAETPFKYSNAR